MIIFTHLKYEIFFGLGNFAQKDGLAMNPLLDNDQFFPLFLTANADRRAVSFTLAE